MSGNRRTFLKPGEKTDTWACIPHNDSEPDSWRREFHCSFHRMFLNYKLVKALFCTFRLTYKYAFFLAFSLFPFLYKPGNGRLKNSLWGELKLLLQSILAIFILMYFYVHFYVFNPHFPHFILPLSFSIIICSSMFTAWNCTNKPSGAQNIFCWLVFHWKV